MRKIVLLMFAATLVANNALAQQPNTPADWEKSVDNLLSEFGMGKNDPPPQPYFRFSRSIEPGTWVAIQSPAGNQFAIASRAESVSAGLDSAMIQIDCMKAPRPSDLPAVEVSLAYWFAGRAFDDDEYSLALFNSASSGRPAGYDLGAGPVSTSHIDFNPFKPHLAPPEYHEMVSVFYSAISKNPPTIEVFFKSDGTEHRAVFPTSGLADAVLEMGRFCPQAQ